MASISQSCRTKSQSWILCVKRHREVGQLFFFITTVVNPVKIKPKVIRVNIEISQESDDEEDETETTKKPKFVIVKPTPTSWIYILSECIWLADIMMKLLSA